MYKDKLETNKLETWNGVGRGSFGVYTWQVWGLSDSYTGSTRMALTGRLPRALRNSHVTGSTWRLREGHVTGSTWRLREGCHVHSVTATLRGLHHVTGSTWRLREGCHVHSVTATLRGLNSAYGKVTLRGLHGAYGKVVTCTPQQPRYGV